MDFVQISHMRIPGISSNKDELSYQVMFFEFFVRNVDPKSFLVFILHIFTAKHVYFCACFFCLNKAVAIRVEPTMTP